MNNVKIYVKHNKEITVSTKFIYIATIYKLWKGGACLIKEEYYASNTPIDVNKVSNIINKEDYVIQRCIELESAPEKYLITKGYKLKKV